MIHFNFIRVYRDPMVPWRRKFVKIECEYTGPYDLTIQVNIYIYRYIYNGIIIDVRHIVFVSV